MIGFASLCQQERRVIRAFHESSDINKMYMHVQHVCKHLYNMNKKFALHTTQHVMVCSVIPCISCVGRLLPT